MRYEVKVPKEIPTWFTDYERVVPTKDLENNSSFDDITRNKIDKYINKYENVKFEITRTKDKFIAKVYDLNTYLDDLIFPISYTKENVMSFFLKIQEDIEHCKMLTEKNKYEAWHKYYINRIINN